MTDNKTIQEKPDFKRQAQGLINLFGLSNDFKHLSSDELVEALEYYHNFIVTPLNSELLKLREEDGVYREPLDGRLDFYRREVSKLRAYLHENRIGLPNQKLFDALYDHIQSLRSTLSDKEKEIDELKKQIYHRIDEQI